MGKASSLEELNRKQFVLDTNVLLHDPACLYGFKHHILVITHTVLEELDKIKSQDRNVSFDARQAIRILDRIINDQMEVSTVGVERNDEGGLLFIPTPPAITEYFELDSDVERFLRDHSNDHKIISDALTMRRYPLISSDESSSIETIFVSKDINARVIAKSLKLRSEDYRAGFVETEQEVDSKGVVYCSAEDLYALSPECPDGRYRFNTIDLDRLLDVRLYPNLAIILSDEEFLIVRSLDGNGFAWLSHHFKEDADVFGVEPRNIEQAVAMTFLKDEEVPCVVITGDAGVGKTFLTIAAAMEGKTDTNLYERIIASRAMSNLDEDIGFLPGTEEEKMGPWMGAVQDNIEALVASPDQNLDHSQSAAAMLDRHIQYRSLNLMRGRSIQDSFFLLDETQNLTPHQVKTLVSRIGNGSKLVSLGDLSQIDNPYLSSYSSGLSHLIERMKDSVAVAHIHLNGSVRSFLSEEANRLL